MAIGFRPKGESGPAYHPDRDYAYITPTLMKFAIERLDDSALTEEALRWKNENTITETEICAVVDALARAQRDFINAADPVSSFEQALARRDFMDVRYPVRQFLFAAIGEVCCAAWFKAVREVSKIGESSPAEAAMADFSAAVSAFVTKSGSADLANAADIATLQMRADVLQARNNVLYKQLQQLTQLLAEKQAEPTTPEKKDSTPTALTWLGWASGLAQIFLRK